MKQYKDYTPKIDGGEKTEEGVISMDPTRPGSNQHPGRSASAGRQVSRLVSGRAVSKGGGARNSSSPEGRGDGSEPGASTRSGQRKGTRTNGKEHTLQTTLPKLFRAQTYRDFAKNPTVRLITGIVLGCIGVWLLVAFVSFFTNCITDQSTITNTEIGTAAGIANKAGEGGARISQFLINDTFGLGSIVIIFWLFAMSFKMFDSRIKFKTVNFTIKCIVALITLSLIVGLITMATDTVVNYGGYHGREVNEFIMEFLGYTGAAILSIMMLSIFCVICLSDLIRWIKKLVRKHREKVAAEREAKAAAEAKRQMIDEMKRAEDEDAAKAGENVSKEGQEEDKDEKRVTFTDATILPDSSVHAENLTYALEDSEETPTAPADTTSEANPPGKEENPEAEAPAAEGGLEPMEVSQNHIGEVDASAPAGADAEPRHPWKFPPFNLLEDRGQVVGIDDEEQLENQEKIRKTLLDFGIPITKIKATVGPTVTLYEIVPEAGVKIAKIRNLVDDIALSLAATGVRIIAPIPGKGTVGIEVANKNPQIVSMRTVLKSKAFQQTRYRLPMALGSTIGGEVYIADLAKMPHLLVAGATGQGKSVGLNAIITSLLYSRRPDELKFVLIDPKMVEFSLYAKIERHYLAKLPGEEDAIITDIPKVAPTLSSLCVEMDGRYKLLRKASVRNVEEYNAKYKEHKLNPNNGHRFLPYIVIIVDEFSDLIMQSGKEVEMPIARLAQKARAVGIHVIIATQRPSTNVITGIIKSNFPGRMAFKVASWVDSKTILDAPGAQQLIGRGDMLISHNSDLLRVQCALVDTEEVEAVCDYISERPGGAGPYILPEPVVQADGDEVGGSEGSYGSERDPLFEEAARSVVQSNQASVSSLQRRFSIGYNRAGKIMDQLEREGIVGPSQGGKPRAVLVDAIMLEDILAKSAKGH